MTDINDPSFVVAAVSGDEDAFETIYNRMALRLRSYFIRRFGFDIEDAEERANDTLLQVSQSITSFDPLGRAKLTTWIYSIAQRKGIDFSRKEAAIRRKCVQETLIRIDDESFSELCAPVSEAILPEALEPSEPQPQTHSGAECRALGALSESERDILRMRMSACMSYAEISEIEGKTEGALRIRFKRAKEKAIEKHREESELDA